MTKRIVQALIILTTVAVVYAVFFPSGSQPASSQAAQSEGPRLSAEQMQQMTVFVSEATRIGTIRRVDISDHAVQVTPRAWAGFDAAGKKNFADLLAAYCDTRGPFHGHYLDVIDSESGRKLAHLGPAGFEVF